MSKRKVLTSDTLSFAVPLSRPNTRPRGAIKLAMKHLAAHTIPNDTKSIAIRITLPHPKKDDPFGLFGSIVFKVR